MNQVFFYVLNPCEGQGGISFLKSGRETILFIDLYESYSMNKGKFLTGERPIIFIYMKVIQ